MMNIITSQSNINERIIVFSIANFVFFSAATERGFGEFTSFCYES